MAFLKFYGLNFIIKIVKVHLWICKEKVQKGKENLCTYFV